MCEASDVRWFSSPHCSASSGKRTPTIWIHYEIQYNIRMQHNVEIQTENDMNSSDSYDVRQTVHFFFLVECVFSSKIWFHIESNYNWQLEQRRV